MKLDREDIFTRMLRHRPEIHGIPLDEYTAATTMMREWIDEICDHAETQVNYDRDPDFCWQMAHNALLAYHREYTSGLKTRALNDRWDLYIQRRKQAEKVTRGRKLEA